MGVGTSCVEGLIDRRDPMEVVRAYLRNGTLSTLDISGELDRFLTVDPSKVAVKQDTYFEGERRKFRENALYMKTALLWELGQITGAEAQKMAPGLMGNTVNVDGPMSEPMFTLFADPSHTARPATIFYQDDSMIVFPNNRSALQAKDGSKAAMSYVHFLIVPRERIYNAVTLDFVRHGTLLQRMRGKATELLGAKHVREYYTDTLGLELDPAVLDPDNLLVVLHVHPGPSIGHLVVHCLVSSLITTNGQILLERTVPLDDVLSVLKREHDRGRDTQMAECYAKRVLDFKHDKQAATAVAKWEASEISGAEAVKAPGGHSLRGMTIAPLKLDDPIFTSFCTPQRPNSMTIFYEDDEMLAFPNNRTGLQAVDGSRAAMSYVHFLIIPKRRIYNAVTLVPEDLPLLLRMERQGQRLLGNPALHEYYANQKEVELSPQLFSQDKLAMFVHCHPDHSVGHLHIHCCLTNLWTKNGRELSHKNIGLRDVINHIRDVKTHRDKELERKGSTKPANPYVLGRFSLSFRQPAKVAPLPTQTKQG